MQEEMKTKDEIEEKDDMNLESAEVFQKQPLMKITNTLLDKLDSIKKEDEKLKEKIETIQLIDSNLQSNNVNNALDGIISFFQVGRSNDLLTTENNDEKSEYDLIYEKINEYIEKEFPIKDKNPTLRDIIYIGKRSDNCSRFDPGDWVELLGPDMKWNLHMITRVIRKAPVDWDWNKADENHKLKWDFTYNAGELRGLNESDLRCPEYGLKKIFGLRPWVWQQWALLKVEHKLRFQEDHEHDFMVFDIRKYASDLWKKWLDHESNVDFKEIFYDDRIGEFGRTELENHIQKPFDIIDRIADSDEWNFEEDDNLNVFTYLSYFGSGLTVPYLVFLIQVMIPLILAYRLDDDNCIKNEPLSGEQRDVHIMIMVILFYYLLTILPDTYVHILDVRGETHSVFSRLIDLRRLLWIKAEDSFQQMIGFRIDIFMNTAYGCFLTILNIMVIQQSTAPIDVVLNSLAFFFIEKIDEDIVKSSWYDPKRRWIRAGAVQMKIETVLEIHSFISKHRFSKIFDIPLDLLKIVCKDDTNFLKNKRLAKQDQRDLSFMTQEELIEFQFANIAYRSGNILALQEYSKPKVRFGMLAKILGCLSPWSPIFEKMEAYRTWSRWEKLLYMSSIPDLDTLFVVDENGNVDLHESLDEEKMKVKYDMEGSMITKFFSHFYGLMTFKETYKSLKPALLNGHFMTFLFRLFDSIFQILFVLLFFLLPIYYFISLYQVSRSLQTGTCINLIDIEIKW